MSKLLFVINPHSSLRNLGEFIDSVKGQLASHQLRFFVPQSIQEYANVNKLAKDCAADVIITVGGDGTTNQLLNELVKAQTPTYFFPSGTANDLAREVGHCRNLQALAEGARTPVAKAIDLIEVNGRMFSTVGGFGIGTVLTKEMNDFREQSLYFKALSKILRNHSYSLLAAKVILQKNFQNLRLEIELEADWVDQRNSALIGRNRSDRKEKKSTHTIETACLLIANQSFLGGNLKVQSTARNNDGVFEIFALKKQEPLQLINSLLQMRQGRIPAGTFLAAARAATIRSVDQQKIGFFADGEQLELNNMFRFKVLDKTLPVLQV